jgi:hypothetical protein
MQNTAAIFSIFCYLCKGVVTLFAKAVGEEHRRRRKHTQNIFFYIPWRAGLLSYNLLRQKFIATFLKLVMSTLYEV